MANAIVTSQTVVLLMKIKPISKLNEVWSPEATIHGTPWKIRAFKNDVKKSLAIFLHCAKKDNTPTWAVSASATIHLMSFGANENAYKYKRDIESFVFSKSAPEYGFSSFIQWDTLLSDETKCVKNDTIELKIEITAEDPNYVDRSILKLESIDKSCHCGSHATYQLTVTNIENLMAVQSPQFIVRGLPWDLTVCKHQTSNIGIMLILHESAKKVSCNAKMTVKLLSSQGNEKAIEKSNTAQIQCLNNMKLSNVVSWNELLKPENGYVNNDSITLEVEIKVDKVEGNIGLKCSIHPHQFECSICLEGLDRQDMSITACGHSFCTVCIIKVVKERSVCPLCKEPVQLNDLRRMYLPAAK